jgi:hypothetical protein
LEERREAERRVTLTLGIHAVEDRLTELECLSVFAMVVVEHLMIGSTVRLRRDS